MQVFPTKFTPFNLYWQREDRQREWRYSICENQLQAACSLPEILFLLPTYCIYIPFLTSMLQIIWHKICFAYVSISPFSWWVLEGTGHGVRECLSLKSCCLAHYCAGHLITCLILVVIKEHYLRNTQQALALCCQMAQRVKNPPAMQEIPDAQVFKIPWRRAWQLTRVFLPG